MKPSNVNPTGSTNSQTPSLSGALMKTKNAKNIQVLLILSTTAMMLISFQNCAQPGSSSLDSSSSSTPSTTVTALSASGAGVSSPDIPPDVVFRDPYTPSKISSYGCTSVTTLAPPADGSAVTIPPRAAGSSGVCYAVKLMNQAAFNPSSHNSVIDPDLVTRNHDLSQYSASDVHNPYSMGRARLQVYLQGERSVLLTGGADPAAKISVDNFMLVGLAPSAQYGNPYYYLAYGTSDATVLYNGDTKNVLFNHQPVLLEPYAVDGTATIPPISLDNKISSEVYYTLDARAIDCGGIGYLSELWVLFQ